MQKTAAITSILLLFALLFACSTGREKKVRRKAFHVDEHVGMTPVKDQGRWQTCCIYAVVAALESEHIERGDSVCLAEDFAVRQLFEKRIKEAYLSLGARKITARSTIGEAFDMVLEGGIVVNGAFERHSEEDRVFESKLSAVVRQCVNQASGVDRCFSKAATLLDFYLAQKPQYTYLFGARYTPQEMARSMAMPKEWQFLTSLKGEPFYEETDVPVPDNTAHKTYFNVPIDTLMHLVDSTLQERHPVVWEGALLEGFSFNKGVGELLDESQEITDDTRQRAFERHIIQDQHAMCLIGTAHDKRGKRYYIAKNSWGTGNPYGGLVFLSEGYLRFATLMVMVRK